MTEQRITFVAGIWTLLSPWLFGYANISMARWSSVLCGIVLVLMSVWAMSGGMPPDPENERGMRIIRRKKKITSTVES